MSVSTSTFIQIPVFLLYSAIFAAFWWRGRRYLPPLAARISFAMLVTQAALIGISILRPTETYYAGRLWHLHGEWGIPASFASLQLAWISGLAFLIVFLAKGRPPRQWAYWAFIGLVFLFFAWDEFYLVHEAFPESWVQWYLVLGVLIVLFTAYTARPLPRREQLGHFGVVFGLGVSVIGAVYFNFQPVNCVGVLFLRFDRCLQYYVWAEMFEFVGIWLVLVSVLYVLVGHSGRITARVRQLVFAIPLIWVLFLFGYSQLPRLEVRYFAERAAVQYEDGLSLRGYRVGGQDDASPERVSADLFTQARQGDFVDKGFSLHLLDQTEQTPIVGRDEWAERQHGFWPFGPDYAPVYRQSVALAIPPATPRNRALWLVLTLWRRGSDYPSLTIQTSDRQQLSDTQVVLEEFVLPAAAAPLPEVALDYRFANGFALRGAALPASATAGETLTVPFTWQADREGEEDWQQFLHFVHEETGALWNQDQPPLGARLPTRLWYAGLRDTESWQVPLPGELAPGRYAVYTGLYRLRDLARLPVSDAAGVELPAARVLLGYIEIGG